MKKYLLVLILSVFIFSCKKAEHLVTSSQEQRAGFVATIILRNEFKEEILFQAPVNISIISADTTFEIQANSREIHIPNLKPGKYSFITSKEGFGTIENEFELKKASSDYQNLLINLNLPAISTTRLENFSVSTERILNDRISLRFNGSVIVSNPQEADYQKENRTIRIFYSTDPNVSISNYLFTNVTSVSYLGSPAATFLPSEIQELYGLSEGAKLYAIAVGEGNYFNDPFNTGSVNLTCLSPHKSNIAEFTIQ